MPLDFGTALAIANAALTGGKKIVDALKKKGDADLAARVIEMMETIQRLRDALADREDSEGLKSRRKFRDNCYWIEDDEGPFCTACWDSNDKLVRMHLGRDNGRAVCPVCQRIVTYDYDAYDAVTEGARRRRETKLAQRRGRSWMDDR